MKAAQMLCFKNSFITKSDPYFGNLKGCLHSLHTTIFTSGVWENTAQHHSVLKILQNTYDSLHNKEDTCTNVASQVTSSQSVPSDKHQVSKSANHCSNCHLYSTGAKTQKSGSSGVRKQQADQSSVDSLLGSSGGSQTLKKRHGHNGNPFEYAECSTPIHMSQLWPSKNI